MQCECLLKNEKVYCINPYHIMSNTELINYVKSLPNDNSLSLEQDEKTVTNFIDKLKTPIDHQKLLDKFEWTSTWFAELDQLLIDIGYAIRDDLITLIKEFLRAQIKKINITKYNELYNAKIWNHFDILIQNPDIIDWAQLSANPAAIDILKANLDIIDWKHLSSNPAAIDLLRMNPKKIDWAFLSMNSSPDIIDLFKMNTNGEWGWLSESPSPAAIQFLVENPDKIEWDGLSRNKLPAAIKILRENLHNVNWSDLSENPSPEAVQLLTENQDKIDWEPLSTNISPAAINLLKMNLDNVDWDYLSANTSPDAIQLLAENPDKINWNYISSNPAAIELLKANLEKIDIRALGHNTNALELVVLLDSQIKWYPHSDVSFFGNYRKTRGVIEIDFEEYDINKNLAHTSFSRKSIKQINKRNLSANSYDYYLEKLNHFNSMCIFQQSRLEL